MSGKSELWLLANQTDRRITPLDASERIQRLQDVLDDIGSRLNKVASAVEKMEQIANCGPVEKNASDDAWDISKEKTPYDKQLPEKQFQPRNSLLTDLFNNNKHMRSVYNIWAAVLFLLFLHTISNDLVETGAMNCGLTTIVAGFDKFQQVLGILLLMTISSFTVYAFHKLWAYERVKFQPNSIILKIWDYSWLFMLIVYQLALLVLPTRATFAGKFPPPSAIVITMEQLRMMMKTHAFVRSTSPAILAYKPHTEGKEFNYPAFSKFIYFFFAPTLVYRDSYPRTKRVRLIFVIFYASEFILTLFFVAFLYERFILPTWQDYGVKKVTLHSFVHKFFHSMLPGVGMYMCGFYCLLHAWSNAWAEVLKFSDRLFYKDWWTARSYDVFYRNWNIVIHDWLYTYLYKDFYEVLVPGNKIVAMSAVFITSAIFHEYIIGIGFRLFFPMMFIVFGVSGYPLVRLTQKSSHIFGNMFLWFSLILGNGVLLSAYAMEYFARINCPDFGNEILDVILPRSWLCNVTEMVEQ